MGACLELAMKSVAFALCAAVAVGLSAAPAGATTMLKGLDAAQCAASGCFNAINGLFTQTVSARDFKGAGPIGAIMFNRALLGAFGDNTFKLTFWSADGQTQLGSFGSFNIAGL